MKSRGNVGTVALVLFSLLFAAVAYSQTQDPPDDVIRTETDLTTLFFTANNKEKAFITTLREEDLRITEDGAPQTIITFQRETDRPLSIAFLIDISASEERTLPQEKAAVRTFIEGVIHSDKDQAAIIPFTGSAFLEQGLTRDVFKIYRALESVEVAMPAYLGSGRPIGGIVSGPGMKATPREGTTAIWDAVAVTSTEILARSTATPATDRRPEVGQRGAEQSLVSNQRRRAIILLTDGLDTTSRVSRDDAIKRALDAETVVYAIGIGDKKYIQQGEINAIATRTGGRAFFPKRETDLRAAFAEIEQELRSQYLIAYSPTNKTRDGGYREMKIEITNPALQKEGLKLRHRPGYFAKPNPAASR
jgi:VWFA-related protein